MKYPATITELLFLRFQTIYGNRVTTMWGDVDPEAVKAEWGSAVAVFGGPDIKAALETMRRECLDYPPTLPRFVGFCRDAAKLRADAMPKLAGPKTTMPEHIRAALRAFVERSKLS